MTQPKQTDDDDKGTMKSFGYVESFFEKRRYYGKYRGKVTANVDPLGQARLCVNVPDVTGLFPKMWARACLPFTGPLMGTYVCPPPVGAGVWVEFEQGDPDKPIWVGCYWDDQPVPAEAGIVADAAMTTGPTSPFMTMEVPGAGIGVTQLPLAFPVCPQPGMVTLYAGAASVALNPEGVSISAPVVSIIATAALSIMAPAVAITGIAGPATFSVNGVQLVVT